MLVGGVVSLLVAVLLAFLLEVIENSLGRTARPQPISARRP